MVGRAKYDAWAAIKGTGSEEAKRRYVALIESLKG
jgi:acyl-CoA-binding protein